MANYNEPWRIENYDNIDFGIKDKIGKSVIEFTKDDIVDMQRIVECVNFCHGVPSSMLSKMRSLIEAMED